MAQKARIIDSIQPAIQNESIESEFHTLSVMSYDDKQFELNKILQHKTQILDFKERRTVIPVTLELDLTLICNDECPNCVHRFAHSQRSLSTAQIEKLLIEAKEIGIKGLTITGGGDPLCHPDINNVLKLIRTCGIPAGLFTNGSKLEKTLSDEILQTFSWVRISLDSASEDSFRLVRGKPGFGERMNALRDFASRRKHSDRNCEIGISFLTMSGFSEEIPIAAYLVRNLGYDYIQFKPMIMFDRPTHHLSSSTSQSRVFPSIKKSLDEQKNGFRVLVSRDKYASELKPALFYSGFHSANFIASVGPSRTGQETLPTLYLDCSAKYIDQWTIGTFSSLGEILKSNRRRDMINNTSSKHFCIRSEKHAVYNTILEDVLKGNSKLAGQPISCAPHHANWL
uniref:4Fe-4S single cluster domain-containing protein n=1 Tax=Candidatus Kentrum sp. LPFa TaxID=2126335 RepID=A0A450VT63_9GAMM|nr:MAG: 4Fe-4S single cluster domain-containing protein [Candidatus Kentron sp. LPFa]